VEYLKLILQAIVLIILSPLVSGIITKIKNNLRFRKGPGIFQPYYNLAKFFIKDEVVSEHSSWIFRISPYIVLSSTITALILIMACLPDRSISYVGEFVAVIFLLSLGRFFLSLAGLDTASTFGGMGSSREMFISSFVEPVLLLSVFAVSIAAGTTNIYAIAGTSAITTPAILAVAAMFLVTLAETSRIPIDNQETHLELTMIHEAMVLEYSGRSLALMELASYVKQMIFFIIISMIALPGFSGTGMIIAKILCISVIVALTEVSFAKMRLFRVVDFLSFAGILSILALIALVLGI
jgi:formate hydrogenlyase subunit 4